ncbi:hypothetical protein IT570_07530 [Candidatus Sumerlaeota bacterium]|nr:hypothetical protein [Candidatus Sumerlaeota bacterium]
MMSSADANPRLYDRLIAVCSLAIGLGLLCMVLLAARPLGASTDSHVEIKQVVTR